MKKISFIHAADLHLDSPMVGLKHLPARIFNRVKESTFVALRRLTAAAIESKVDFVILAGDLFDGEDRSLRAQSRFRTEMVKLAENGIPVYVVHGNHDHLNGSWVHLEMPPNVHVFKSDVETKILQTKSGGTIHLYGFSYPTRHVFDRKIDNYHKVEGASFHIGILHGNENSRSEHDNYAPFSVKDLQEKGFDYWALGHIHKRTILSEMPFIIYPGNIQGRNKKETGRKGIYHVTLSENDDRELEFIETSDIVWEEVTLDAGSVRSFHELLQLCRTTINHLRNNHGGILATLYLKNIYLDDTRERRSLDSQLLELLLDDEVEEESFVWIVDLIVLEGPQTIDKEQLKIEASFYSELFETIENFDQMESVIAPLYEHQLGRKYLAQLTAEEQKELIKNAEKLLIELLYQS